MLVAVLIVLAGCSAVGGSDTSTSPSALTPAPVPTGGPDGALAPGLSASGVTDPVRLAASHRGRLLATNYTERTTTVVRAEGRTLTARNLSVRRDGDTYLLGFELVGERRRESRSYQTVAAAVWSNGSAAVQRLTDRSNTTEYETVEAGFYRSFARPNVRLYAQVLEGTSPRVTPTGEGYRLSVTVESVPAAFGLRGAARTGPATVQATLSPAGVLRRAVLTYPVTYTGREATLTHTLAYTDVGTTRVSRPAWFGTALAGVSVPTASRGTGPSDAGNTTATATPSPSPPTDRRLLPAVHERPA
jgi:hypothetical protein